MSSNPHIDDQHCVVITGAGGFVGSAVSRLLVKKIVRSELHYPDGASVTKIVGFIGPSGATNRLDEIQSSPHFTSIKVDLTDGAETTDILSALQPRMIIHTAIAPEFYTEKSEEELHRLVDLPLEVLCQSLTNTPSTRLITTGTSTILSPSMAMDEMSPVAPHPGYLNYSLHKIREERTLHRLTKTFSISWIHLRLFYMFGPYESPKRLLPQVVSGIIKGRPIALGPGGPIRDFTHIDDIADAYRCSLQHQDGGETGSIFNIGSGHGYSIEQFVNTITTELGRSELIEFDAITTRDSEQSKPYICDPQKAARELGWQAQDDVLSRMREATHWWKNHLHSQPMRSK